MLRLKLLFAAILVAMLAVTTWASLDRSVFEAGNLLDDPWGVATLADAYMGFLTFYAWVAYKERGVAGRVLWFVLIMGLGNIAMSAYVLLQLFRLPPGATVETLLLRDRPR
jgi:membrane protease YdiL (CAAX protease family)